MNRVFGVHFAYISIHALRKESDYRSGNPNVIYPGISIHALRKESDPGRQRPRRCRRISIHALRKESDSGILVKSFLIHDFNPRSP